MVSLENVHKAMNERRVQDVVQSLYFEWMYKELDGLEDNALALRQWTKALFKMLGYTPVTEEEILAAETLFQNKIEAITQ